MSDIPVKTSNGDAVTVLESEAPTAVNESSVIRQDQRSKVKDPTVGIALLFA